MSAAPGGPEADGGAAPADANLLARVPLLENLRAGQLTALAGAAVHGRTESGHPICRAGHPSPGLVVLRRGRASRLGLELGDGDCFGELSALDLRMADETVTAIDDVEYLALPARGVHDAIRQDPELGIALLREVSRYLAAPPDELSPQLMRYAADLSESFREGERRQAALRRSVLGTVRALVGLAEAKHPRATGHASRAAHTARALATRLGLAEDDVNHAALGGLLHDVGFIIVEAAVLEKQGPLTETEQRQIQAHPLTGARIIEHVDFLQPVVPFVLHHHERYDGRGYPQGLAGKAIPLEGRLMAAVETFESLRTDRPEQPSPTTASMVRALRAQAGRGLDREMTIALCELLESGQVTHA